MDEKEAINLKDYCPNIYLQGVRDGYLEAIEKAKVLEDAVRYAIDYVYTTSHGARPRDRYKQMNKIKYLLSHWRHER